MKESAVFYVPQNPLGRGRGNKTRNTRIASASINTSWLEACLSTPVNLAKFLNKAAKSCQEWLTFTLSCRNSEDLKHMSGRLDFPALLEMHFVVTLWTTYRLDYVDFLTETLSGLVLSPYGNSYWSLGLEGYQAGLRARETWKQHVLFKYLTRTARSYRSIRSYRPKWLKFRCENTPKTGQWWRS